MTSLKALGAGKHHPLKFAQHFKKVTNQQASTAAQNELDGTSPTTAAALDLLKRSPTQTLTHLAGLLTKNGKRQDGILARVHSNLSSKYGHENPIEVAIEAVRPIIRYYKPKHIKSFVPEALWPKSSVGMTLRWIVKGAERRTYGPWKIPNLERGLRDEIESILNGSSSLFARKLQCHKNPN